MVEPLVFKPGDGGYGVDGDAEKIVPLVRQAAELGADVIKADPTDDLDDYHRVVEAAGGAAGARARRRPRARRGGAAPHRGADAPGRRGHRLRAQRHPAPRSGGHDARADGRRPRGTSRRRARADRVRTVRFGIIGGGLMGREFASAAARWIHLADSASRPELVHVCDANPDVLAWYERLDPQPRRSTDWRELLADEAVEAVYCAVPHHLHAELYAGDPRGGQAPARREAVRDRPAGRTRRSWPRSSATGAARALLVGAAVLPRRPGGGPLDRRGPLRPGARGPQRSSCTRATSTRTSRSTGSAMAALQRRLRLHGRPRHARAAPAAARGLDAAQRARDPLATSSPSARTPTASRSPATPGTTRCCCARPSTTASRSRCGSRRSGSRRARRTRG